MKFKEMSFYLKYYFSIPSIKDSLTILPWKSKASHCLFRIADGNCVFYYMLHNNIKKTAVLNVKLDCHLCSWLVTRNKINKKVKP
jgi:hypothetical protein